MVNIFGKLFALKLVFSSKFFQAKKVTFARCASGNSRNVVPCCNIYEQVTRHWNMFPVLTVRVRSKEYITCSFIYLRYEWIRWFSKKCNRGIKNAFLLINFYFCRDFSNTKRLFRNVSIERFTNKKFSNCHSVNNCQFSIIKKNIKNGIRLTIGGMFLLITLLLIYIWNWPVITIR